jgi:hypothetical protein
MDGVVGPTIPLVVPPEPPPPLGAGVVTVMEMVVEAAA